MRDRWLNRAKARGVGLRAVVLMLVAVAVAMAAPVQAGAASPNTIDKTKPTELVIHKFEQPKTPGDPGTGLPIDTGSLVPVPGVTFTAKKVPGIELWTDTGWAEANALTPVKAAELVKNVDPEDSGVTGPDGELTLDLSVGLYYVEEVPSKADSSKGVLPGPPFLVALPMPHPDPVKAGEWLYIVHVYPKNSVLEVKLEVTPKTCERVVEWTATAWIPRATLDSYRIVNTLAPGTTLAQDPKDVVVRLGNTRLVRQLHYTVTGTKGGSGPLTIEFTNLGLVTLMRDRDAEVTVVYRTELPNPPSLLPYQNQVHLYVNDANPVRDLAATVFDDDCTGASPTPTPPVPTTPPPTGPASPSPTPTGTPSPSPTASPSPTPTGPGTPSATPTGPSTPTPSEPGKPDRPGGLPGTGAQVSGLLLVTTVLLIGGTLLVRRGRRDDGKA